MRTIFQVKSALFLGVLAGFGSVHQANADCDRNMSASAEVTYKAKFAGVVGGVATVRSVDSFSGSGHSGWLGTSGCNDARERACDRANDLVQNRYTQQALSDLVCAKAMDAVTQSNGAIEIEITSARSVCSDPDVTKNRNLPFSKTMIRCSNSKVAELCQSALTKEAQFVRDRAMRFADAIQKQQLGAAQEAWVQLGWSHDVFLGNSKNPVGQNFKECLK